MRQRIKEIIQERIGDNPDAVRELLRTMVIRDMPDGGSDAQEAGLAATH